MPRLIERTFNPSVPVVVRRMFVAAGRHWNPGDVFDWPRLAIAQRRVRQLFDNGKLMHPEVAASPLPSAPVVEEPVKRKKRVKAVEEVDTSTTPVPTIEQEMQDEDILAAAQEGLPEAAPEAASDSVQDDLDDLDMIALREIATVEGVPFRVSATAQREAIRDHRKGVQK